MKGQEFRQILGMEPESVAEQMVRNHLAISKHKVLDAEECVALMLEFSEWLVDTNKIFQNLILDKVKTQLPEPVIMQTGPCPPPDRR